MLEREHRLFNYQSFSILAYRHSIRIGKLAKKIEIRSSRKSAFKTRGISTKSKKNLIHHRGKSMKQTLLKIV